MHFPADCDMVAAWASRRSARWKRGDAEGGRPEGVGCNRQPDFRGERRGNEMREEKTDPEAQPWRKGQTAEAKPSCLGPALTGNRHALILNECVSYFRLRACRAGNDDRDCALPRGSDPAPMRLQGEAAREQVQKMILPAIWSWRMLVRVLVI